MREGIYLLTDAQKPYACVDFTSWGEARMALTACCLTLKGKKSATTKYSKGFFGNLNLKFHLLL